MNKRLIIVGAGGHGKVTADIALKMNKWDEICFVDDSNQNELFMGFKLIGKTAEVFSYLDDSDIFVAIGSNKTRRNVQSQLENAGASMVSLIHPQSILGEQVRIGAGTAIMAGAVVNCCSVIGRGCIVNTNASVDHDNVLADYVHISPGASIAGTVSIGRNTWLGVGSAVSNNVRITDDCIIGAGAVVVKDITEPGTYVGVPARRV